jgi:hypothetical protein
MGIKNPVEDIIKTEKQRQEMAKAAGLKDLPPTAVYQKHFEESTGVPYPKVQVPDPVTGQVAERAAPYLIDNTKTREKLNKEVGAAIWAAQQKWADPSNPSTYELAKGRVVAEGELQAKLGLNWKEQLSSAPDMAQQFESVFTPKEEPAPPVKEASPKENATMAFFKGMMETIQGMPNLASNVGSAIKSVVTDAMPKRPALAMPRKGTTSRGLTYTVE